MTINVGVDLHKTQFTVFVKQSGNQFEQYSTNEEGYKRFLVRAERWLEQGKTVRAGVESTGNTRYFKNVMERA